MKSGVECSVGKIKMLQILKHQSEPTLKKKLLKITKEDLLNFVHFLIHVNNVSIFGKYGKTKATVVKNITKLRKYELYMEIFAIYSQINTFDENVKITSDILGTDMKDLIKITVQKKVDKIV